MYLDIEPTTKNGGMQWLDKDFCRMMSYQGVKFLIKNIGSNVIVNLTLFSVDINMK